MGEMKVTKGGPQLPASPAAQIHVLPADKVSSEQLKAALDSVSMLLRITNERMAALEAEVKRLTKVTPAQASALNRAIRDRAAQICEKHRAPGCEKAVAAAIRRAIKETCGIGSARELPRCDYAVATRQVAIWDNYRLILEIKAKEAAKHETK